MLFEEKNGSEDPDNPMELWLEQLTQFRVEDQRISGFRVNYARYGVIPPFELIALNTHAPKDNESTAHAINGV